MKRSPWRYIWKSEGIRNRLLLTLGVLVIYRLVANIPVPGFNAQVIRALNTSRSAAGDLISILNVLSGGTLSSFSILAMGVYPYITASIILQLLGPIIPSIQDKLKNDPKEGRKWMEKWTMYLSIPLAFLSAIGQIGLFNQILPGYTVLKDFGWSGPNLLPTLANVLVMIAAGVSTADDCYNVIRLGADGTGATSGILNAPSPAQRVREMAEAIVKAGKERNLI